MNNVAITGRLTADPIIREGKKDVKVANFTVASKDDLGNTDFPRVVCFGKTAQFVEKYIRKGRMVAVEGKIETGSYVNRNGEKVYTTQVRAKSVQAEDSAKPTENIAYREDLEDINAPAIPDEDDIPDTAMEGDGGEEF